MAADEMGIACVPTAMVINELNSGEPIQINYPWTPKSLHFLARYESERSSGLVVRAAQIAGEVSQNFLHAQVTERIN